MINPATFRNRAYMAVTSLAAIWLVSQFLIKGEFGTAPSITSEEHPWVYLALDIARDITLVSTPFVILYYGLIAVRIGEFRREGIASMVFGGILAMVSLVLAAAWHSTEARALQSLLAEYPLTAKMNDVVKADAIPLQQRAELSRMIANGHYRRSGERLATLGPDGTLRAFEPTPDEVAEHAQYEQGVAAVRYSVYLCLAWIVYALAGAVGAIALGLKLKIAPRVANAPGNTR
jgi:hypothetical protein